jgi:glutamate racemase
VETLRDFGASIIVIACNTATVKCIERLRIDYPKLQFVGTEPAVKLALKNGAKKTLVLATPNTINSERVHLLAQNNASPSQIVNFLPCPGLAETIEKHHNKDTDRILAKLKELLTLDESYDAVVLGCTHYSLIKEQIQQFYPNAKLLDGNDGVAKRVEAIVSSSATQKSP